MIVRELYARLGLDVDAQSFETGENLIARARQGLVVMRNLAIAAAGGLAVFGRQVAQAGADAQDAADRLGVTTDAVQELAYASKLSGTSFESLQQGLAFMARKGVKDLDQGLADLADEIAALPPGGARAAAAMEALGRGGVDLVPLLSQGAEGLARLRQEARDMGLVVGGEAVQKLAKADDAFDRLGERLKGLRNRVFVQWLDRLKGLDLLERALVAVSDAAEVLAKNIDVIGVAFASFTGAYLVMLVSGLATAAGGFGALASAALAAAGATIAAWVAAAVPFLAIAAIIGSIILIVDDLWTSFTGGEGIIIPTLARLGDALKGVFTTAVDWWKGLFVDFFDWTVEKVKALGSWIGETIGAPLRYVQRLLGGKTTSPDGVPTVGPDGATVSVDPAVRFGAAATPGASAAVSVDPAVRFGAAATPGASAAVSPGRAVVSPSFNASFVVNGAPGQDPQAIAGQVRDAIDQWHATQMRQTYAAVGGG